MAAPQNITAPSYILIDGVSGIVLAAKNENTRMFPASTTKIMTAILAIEKGDLDAVMTANFEDVNSISWDSSKVWLSEFEEMTVRDLIFSLLINSANDAANVLARHVSGSYEAFAEEMNKRAMELGAKDTHFVNAHGLHHDNHYTTAYDLAVIAKHAMTLPLFREAVSTREYTIAPTNRFEEQRILRSTNHLLNPDSTYYYEDATGIKTGYTAMSKSCLVSSAQTDEGFLIAVVLGVEKPEGRSLYFSESRELLQYGFKECVKAAPVNRKEQVATLPVKNAKGTLAIPMIAKDDVRIVLPEGANTQDITTKEYIIKDASAPFKKDQVIGRNEYWYKDVKVGETLLLCDKDYEKLPLAFVIYPLGKVLSQWWVWVLIVMAIIFVKILRNSKKKRRVRKR